MSTNFELSYKDSLDVTSKFADNDELAELRFQLAKFTADTFSQAGEELHAIGHIFGTDRKNGESPFGNGNDEVVAVSLLLRIGGQLTSASADLFNDGRHYAAAALLRQLVEVEYLAWAFETRDNDAERWIRSTSEERQSFFAPAKIRKASQGKFRGEDYGYHCELGGHPVPGAHILLRHDEAISQLLLSDLLGHTGRVWDHVVGWASDNTWAAPLSKRYDEMHRRYAKWKHSDVLNLLPPPP
ncbi:MAG TPA: hypothetical protein VMJ32_06795 [Pirellulales bacterium]|nr:hypothetical protein [Pirellulales bacterium]